MNILFKSYPVFTLLSLSLFLISFNTVAKVDKKASKIKVKCHVELVGGTDIIHFGIIKSQGMTNYSQWLVGKKIATGISKQKQQVHKVKECVKSREDFSNELSKQLDENTAR